MFNHRQATCANVNNQALYLCFNDGAGDYRLSVKNIHFITKFRTCRVASSPTGSFEKIADSSYDHYYTRIAASDCKLCSMLKVLSFFSGDFGRRRQQCQG